MRKILSLCTFALLTSFLSACEITNENPFNGPKPNSKPLPTYSEQGLSGKIFGKDWVGKTAVVRPYEENKLALDIYSESPASPCKVAFTSSPYISTVIPEDYEVKEYSLESSNNPMLTFIEITDIAKNVSANEAKLKISQIDPTGFHSYLYAKAVEHDGTISEVNGKIQVIDCRKLVDFKIWDEFAGWFDLVELDGKNVYGTSDVARHERSKYFHRPSNKYVNTFVIPLYHGASDNVLSSYSIGPMEGLGTTTIKEHQNIKTIDYIYNGPISLGGTEYTLNLSMKVVKERSSASVSYTLEIPGQVNKVSHSFKMKWQD